MVTLHTASRLQKKWTKADKNTEFIKVDKLHLFALPNPIINPHSSFIIQHSSFYDKWPLKAKKSFTDFTTTKKN